MEKFSLTSLYDKLDSHLRELETLGLTTDKCVSILYPMVESCFPADFLKAWNRKEKSYRVTEVLEGPQEEPSEENLTMTVLSLFVNEAEICNLWKLDLIGVNDTLLRKKNPMFDALARLANYPSLNQYFAWGPSLIELIPDILLRFRKKEFGVIADIRNAFLQINIRKEDRDFLQFLCWEKMDEKKLRVFRHTRVVSGGKFSPFLLASVIEYHIQKCEFAESFKERILKSFYVVNSVDCKDQLNEVIANSKTLMANGGFDLGEWEWSGHCENDSKNETQHDRNEEIGNKSKVSYVLTNNEASGVENWYYRYFSNYDRIIRLVAWILRFKHNSKNVTGKKHGELTVT
ncbi:integrase catalytic domain-containing protein [Trichonephila clavipes]|nr:integrase catalytic domain-containing protein [Trichonephila clavipes]